MSQAKNNRFLPLGLAVFGGVIMWLAWPTMPTTFLVFIGLTPVLAIEDYTLKTSKNPAYKAVLYTYLMFLIWNILTTYWIWYASPGGAAGAIILNSLIMTMPVYFAQRVRKYFGRAASYAALVSLWILFEVIHLNWDAPWPWLVLGNVFAMFPDWVQWYEFTGALGGTLWVWVINIFIYNAFLKKYFSGDAYMEEAKNPSVKKLKNIAFALAGILLPILISYLIKPEEPVLDDSKNIVVVQPNIDPYGTKFESETYADQLRILIDLSEKQIDKNTALVIWPETAIAENLNQAELFDYMPIQATQDFLRRHPHVKLITGANAYQVYALNSKITPTARLFSDKSAYYDRFNAALLIDTSRNYDVYHKSKLVPGVEKMPYPAVFGLLESLIIDLGGASGSLGSQDSAGVFNAGNGIVAAPIICYESIFGDYVNDFVHKGANIITIITNDGWWRETPGHRQHLHYAVLRAIETRRFIARSANTGISCYILPTGKILQPTKFWEPAVLKSGVFLNNDLTFYTLYGDYIGSAAKYISFIFLFIAFFGRFMRRRSAEKQLEEQ
ncbi:MAG: apolipoprotein N-acyltransferase [Bacteroidia bacterium]